MTMPNFKHKSRTTKFCQKKTTSLCLFVCWSKYKNLAMKWNERLCMTSIGGRSLCFIHHHHHHDSPLEKKRSSSTTAYAERNKLRINKNKMVCVCWWWFRVQNSANTYNQNFIEDRLGFFSLVRFACSLRRFFKGSHF